MKRRIRIEIEPPTKSGLLFASSPDMPGLLVAEHTMEMLRQEVPLCIDAMLEVMGEAAEVEIVWQKEVV